MFESIVANLEIIPVKKLLQHEEVIEQNLHRLKEGMLNIGQLVDPLIIDKKTKTVLDGNHRLKVLETIKVPYAVCQTVDYSRPDIRIDGWFPVSEFLDLKTISALKVKTEKVDLRSGMTALQEKKALFMFVKKEAGETNPILVEPGQYSLDELIDLQKDILRRLSNKFSLNYIASDVVGPEVEAGRGVLFRKVYSKDEVIDRAMKKKPFPCKATRHIIPNRIIRLNMRLGWLHQGEEEARQYLEKMVRERVYEGNIRRYTEPVIVIY